MLMMFRRAIALYKEGPVRDSLAMIAQRVHEVSLSPVMIAAVVVEIRIASEHVRIRERILLIGDAKVRDSIVKSPRGRRKVVFRVAIVRRGVRKVGSPVV